MEIVIELSFPDSALLLTHEESRLSLTVRVADIGRFKGGLYRFPSPPKQHRFLSANISAARYPDPSSHYAPLGNPRRARFLLNSGTRRDMMCLTANTLELDYSLGALCAEKAGGFA